MIAFVFAMFAGVVYVFPIWTLCYIEYLCSAASVCSATIPSMLFDIERISLELDIALAPLEACLVLLTGLGFVAFFCFTVWRRGWHRHWKGVATQILADAHAEAERVVDNGNWWAGICFRIAKMWQ